jgi:AAA+ superfamily predicted ATPase
MKLYDRIATAYKNTTANLFAVTGNIHDIALYSDGSERRADQIEEILMRKLEANNHVVYFSPSVGMRYTKPEFQAEFYALDTTLQEIHAKAFALDYAQTKYDILSGLHMIKVLLASYRTMRDKYGSEKVKNLVVLIDDADLVFPSKPIEYMGSDEKLTLSLAREMLDSSDFIGSSDAVILLSSSFLSLHDGIRSISGIHPVEVPLPDEAARRDFIGYENAVRGRGIAPDQVGEIARLSAGITLSTLRAILKQEPERILQQIRDEVASIIEKSLGDHVRVLHPAYGFDHVIGYDALKAKARTLIRRMHGKHPWRALAYIGATGTGKDFQAEAFLHEAGIPVMKLETIKSKWYGETAVIVEKIKMVARSFSRVVIFKPEADKLFPDPEADDAHQTDQELTAIFLDWMADSRDRGRIFWVFNTSRPQLFPVDFQRRIEIKLPIFDLDAAERRTFIERMFERKEVPVGPEQKESLFMRLTAFTDGFSSDQIRMLADEVAAELDVEPERKIMEIAEDLNVNIVREERRRQAQYAAAFSTYKSLVPESYRKHL